MPLGLADPASCFGVGGERLNVNTLGGQDREMRRVSAKARALFTDVRVRARSLSAGA
jgi:hypothetical protein